MAPVKDQILMRPQKHRWNQFLELVRIPSPPRYELLKAAEIHRRLVAEWGFSSAEVVRADGIIAGSDTNTVDGLPVYNACVVIKGSVLTVALTRNSTRASSPGPVEVHDA